MKPFPSSHRYLAFAALGALTISLACESRAQKMFPLPTYREAVDQAISAQNLRAVAADTTDAEVLLGLASLAQTGDPVRKELAELSSQRNPKLTNGVVVVLSLTLDGVNESTVNTLIQRDPENALGHYLWGVLLYRSGQEKEALEAFKKAGACAEFRLYETITGPALLKALDALKLQGEDRLCALSWMATRSSNFGSMILQDIQRCMTELARAADLRQRKEISEQLLLLAGHLFASNFNNRLYAQRALESAFRLKAELAAQEKSPTMNGYASVVQAMVSVSWPGINENDSDPVEIARFLPSSIHRAFAFVAPSKSNNLSELDVSLSGADKAAFEQTKTKAIAAAKTLIDLADDDPDSIIGPYLKGLPPRKYEDGPWVSYYTPVEKLMTKKPELFRAAAANEQAMNALWEAGKNDVIRSNMRQMMQIGLSILSYANDHDESYPANLALLVEKGEIKPPLTLNSRFTQKPYIYVAAGLKRPTKDSDWNRLILLYDDQPLPKGGYQCVMADGSGQVFAADKFRQMLKDQGK